MVNERSLLDEQQRILEMITQQASLQDTLSAVAGWTGLMLPEALVSIMRYDAGRNTLSLVPGEPFSNRYTEQMQQVEIGPGVGTCGTAAHERRLVITEDIRADPHWDGYREAAAAEFLRACWSIPILTAEGELLGTFATYYRHPARPLAEARQCLARGAGLAALALLRYRDNQNHRTLAEWHQALFINYPDGVYEFDLEGRFQRCNAGLERISGYPEASLMGLHFRDFIDPDFREMTESAFASARNGESVTYETKGRHASGVPYYLEVTNFPVVIDDEIAGVYGICRDVSARKEQEAELIYQARHDWLTGLLNRTEFNERLETLFWSHQSNGHLLVVMYLDLDGFKSINDGLGHNSGNQVLQSVARRLDELAGRAAGIARLAGDEFGIILPETNSRKAVIQLAEKMLEALGESIVLDEQRVHLSASIGIACTRDPVARPHELLQHANLAVERSKRQGRNTWQWYSGARAERTRHSVAMRHDLHQALREGQFVLHYQPQFDVSGNGMNQVEALVRWCHPDRGVISPGEFIPVAEDTGQIIPLGRWILRHACREIADFNAKYDQSLSVAVNLSPMQFHREGFMEDVYAALTDSGLASELLELEVTESVLLDGAAPVVRLMKIFRDMGVRLALDDFGTGFSSLSYLQELPIQKVKLDRGFIDKLLTDKRSAAIVHGVIAMAHHMDLLVVAKGIETPEQQDDLNRRHCDLIQGFLLARPMPMDDLEGLFAGEPA